MENAIIQALAQALAPALGLQYKDVPSGTPSTPYIHGPGGIFGVSGLERNVISARVKPTGLAGLLPPKMSRQMYPLFPYITGFGATTGSNPTTVCSDGKVAGPLKGCLQTAAFGRYTFMTRELERNRIGQANDRGEFFDLSLVNDPLLSDLASITPASAGQSLDLNREIVARFIEVGVAFQNVLARQFYTGNPSNGNGAGYKEFRGADLLISTGKTDSLTNIACPALDSDVKSFAYGLVNPASGASSGIVRVLTYMYRYVRSNADRMGFTNPEWAFTMRRDLFYEVTAEWPCAYLTYRCRFEATDGTMHVNVDAGDQIALRDTMRAGSYLLIDGDKVPVILDDGIVEETEADAGPINGGQYASDIYLFPLRAGGYQLTYFEFLDYNATQAMDSIGPARGDYWTDGGKFLWHHKPPNLWCEQWVAKCEPRLILQAPQLAGRLQDVRYQPLQHTRDPFPTDPYFEDGGVSTARAGPSYYLSGS